MKTTVIESKGAVAANNSKVENKVNANNGKGNLPAKLNGLPVSTAFNGDAKKEEPKKEEAKKDEVKADIPAQTVPQPEPAKAEEQKSQAEPTKKEIKEEAKLVLNLESTLKLVEELHRRKIQRDRLLDTINTLEAFEIAQKEDAEETDNNHFQGCVLTIEDDNRNKFSTKNPVIIRAVAQFVNHMCIDRLAEIEAGITIPA